MYKKKNIIDYKYLKIYINIQLLNWKPYEFIMNTLTYTGFIEIVTNIFYIPL